MLSTDVYKLYNAYVTMTQNLRKTQARLLRYGTASNESKQTCLRKIANRLYEANVFATIFHSVDHIDFQNISRIPVIAQQNLWSISDAWIWFAQTVKRYHDIRKLLRRRI